MVRLCPAPARGELQGKRVYICSDVCLYLSIYEEEDTRMPYEEEDTYICSDV
jgi:hypothetical protein